MSNEQKRIKALRAHLKELEAENKRLKEKIERMADAWKQDIPTP